MFRARRINAYLNKVMAITDKSSILITGATGYIGGRLLHRLEESALPVRCLTRRPEHLRGTAANSTEIVAGDVLDYPSLEQALEGIARGRVFSGEE